MSVDLAVTGLGALTPVGLSAPATCSALRAGIARLIAFEDFEVTAVDAMSKPIPAGRVPTEWLRGGPKDEEWPGHERFQAPPPAPGHVHVPPGTVRLLELAGLAVREAVAQAGLAAHAPRSTGFYLGVADGEDATALAKEVTAAAGLRCDAIRANAEGRAASLAALAHALRHLEADRVACAVVCGVDSLLRPEVLSRLDAAGRLKSASSRDGFLPGEAAACVVIETVASARERGARALARLASAAVSEEPTAGTDEACRGEGLTHAVRGALAGRKAKGGWLVVCDLNGERYRMHEWALVNARLSHAAGGFPELWHPADCIGEVGAASGTLAAVWAATALDKGYAPQPRALLWSASDGPRRAAAAMLPAAAD